MNTNDLWVFGYGSLIWNPGFKVATQKIATLDGYMRSFCMRSIHHRGTQDHNGLVLALDEQDGAHCQGVAFNVAREHADQTITYLRERELISSAYVEKILPIKFQEGGEVLALTYVIDPHHVQYCHLELEEQAQMISTAVGGRGPNTEYLYNTTDCLNALGLHDPELDWLTQRVKQLAG
ncbi:gamma-glutamylcyclotransferase [Amylibacter kogurei]|uniref:glutathione-specific gamma-glutamylcyclotransferase n=1 Tax=Paramylibacter kogurei TaxID=1889778 RepID=A0A2G5K8G9_9RHOB|nr:gamma-glutamylcyclotransferase [Amylibacter kogurei]PIB25831.1 gamma-glutamylcyclotransferase [Amylibacter kogurei]